MIKPIPSSASDRLEYNPETGRLFWAGHNKHHPDLIGKEAGCPSEGYRIIKIDGVSYRAHRVAWFIATGEQPFVIDHINGNGLDNRLSNLRNVSHSENAKNHGQKGKDGLPLGVRLLPSGRFQSRITCDGRVISLGSFETAKQASDTYITKRKELFSEYARG